MTKSGCTTKTRPRANMQPAAVSWLIEGQSICQKQFSWWKPGLQEPLGETVARFIYCLSAAALLSSCCHTIFFATCAPRACSFLLLACRWWASSSTPGDSEYVRRLVWFSECRKDMERRDLFVGWGLAEQPLAGDLAAGTP